MAANTTGRGSRSTAAGQDQSVRREGHPFVGDPDREVHAAGDRVARLARPGGHVEPEVGRHHLAGAKAPELVLEGVRLAGRDEQDTLLLGREEREPADLRRVERDAHVVAGPLPDVVEGDPGPEGLALAHDGRHREGHVEPGVADEDSPARGALHLHGTGGQALERGAEGDVERVEALAVADEDPLGLALLAGGEDGDVVLGARGLVRPEAEDRPRRRGLLLADPLGEIERVVERPRGAVLAGGQVDGALHVAQHEARPHREPRSPRTPGPRRTASGSRRCPG